MAVVFHDGRLCPPESKVGTVPPGATLALFPAGPARFRGCDLASPSATLADFLAAVPPGPHTIYSHRPDPGGPRRPVLRRTQLLPLRGVEDRPFAEEEEDALVDVRVTVGAQEYRDWFESEQKVSDVRLWLEDKLGCDGAPQYALRADGLLLDDDDWLCDFAADHAIRIRAVLDCGVELVVGKESVFLGEDALTRTAAELANAHAGAHPPGGTAPRQRLIALGRVLAPDDTLAGIGATAPVRVFVHRSCHREKYADVGRTPAAADVPKRNIAVRAGEARHTALCGVAPGMLLLNLGRMVLWSFPAYKSVSFVVPKRRLCMRDENAEACIREGVEAVLHGEDGRPDDGQELLAWMAGGETMDKEPPDDWQTVALIHAERA
jgi:hypothetical protein